MEDLKNNIFGLKTKHNNNIMKESNQLLMNKKELKKLSKSQLIDRLMKLEKLMKPENKKPEVIIVDDTKPTPRVRKPIPMPRTRKSVKSMVDAYEQNIIFPPLEFRDKPIPAPRNFIIPPPLQFRDKPIPAPRTKKPVPAPVPAPRTKIEQTDEALKGFTKSFEISIENNKDPLVQLQNTRKAAAFHIISILTSMKGLKFIETLKVTFTKMSDGKIIYKTAYFNSPPLTILNNPEINESLEASKQNVLNKIAVWISEGSGWTIQSVDNHYLNVVKYQPMKGSSYIELPQELRNSAKGLINMKNEDNECFRWCHIRHLKSTRQIPTEN